MKFRIACAAAVLLALPAVAMAQPIEGIYVSLGAGFNAVDQYSQAYTFENFQGTGGPNVAAPGPFPVTSKYGYAFSGAIGYGLGKGIRLELEGSYRTNPLNASSAFGNPLKYSGNDQKTSAILSINYDIDMGLPIYPYVGAGAGVALNTWSHVTRTGTNLIQQGAGGGIVQTSMTGSNAINDSQAVLALQFTAGVAYPIASVPGLSLTLDYKYFAMPDQRSFRDVLTFSCPGGGACGAAAGRPTPSSGAGYGTYDTEYNHSIMFGVRYAFGGPAKTAAPPAVVPAAVAATARSYLVFFDWDKAVLTERARQVVADAALNARKVQTTRIEVNGYTDTSGTPTYNKGLATRRAEAVSAQLMKNGITKEEIVVMSYGDTHPLVPTGPGVREPQNRRVEIILK